MSRFRSNAITQIPRDQPTSQTDKQTDNETEDTTVHRTVKCMPILLRDLEYANLTSVICYTFSV